MRRRASKAAGATGEEAAVDCETGRAITLACVLCDEVNHYRCGMKKPRLAGLQMPAPVGLICDGWVFSQRVAPGLLATSLKSSGPTPDQCRSIN